MYVYRLSYPSIQSTNTASDRKVLRNEIQKKIVLIKICFTEKMYVSMYVCMYVCMCEPVAYQEVPGALSGSGHEILAWQVEKKKRKLK